MGRGGEEVREGRGRRKGLKLGIFMRKANMLSYTNISTLTFVLLGCGRSQVC